jgi:Holliday junction resolvase RusA-like endonuclease
LRSTGNNGGKMPAGNGSPVRTRVKRKVELRLDLPALSTNKLFNGRKRRSYFYKSFRKTVFKLLSEKLKDTYSLNGNLKLTMTVGFSSQLSDLSNSIKGIEDVLCEFLGINDRQIVMIELHKRLVHKGDEFMDISISKVNRSIDMRKKNAKTVR